MIEPKLSERPCECVTNDVYEVAGRPVWMQACECDDVKRKECAAEWAAARNHYEERNNV